MDIQEDNRQVGWEEMGYKSAGQKYYGQDYYYNHKRSKKSSAEYGFLCSWHYFTFQKN